MEDEIHGLLLTGKSEGAFSRQSVVRINVHVIRVFYLLPPRPRVPTINSFSVSKKAGREPVAAIGPPLMANRERVSNNHTVYKTMSTDHPGIILSKQQSINIWTVEKILLPRFPSTAVAALL